jgi:antitoxin HicB
MSEGRTLRSIQHRGPTLESFLDEEGILVELQAVVAKEAIAFQLERAMKTKRNTRMNLT